MIKKNSSVSIRSCRKCIGSSRSAQTSVYRAFLVWQAYYDAHQKPPPWGERSHFVNGIIEYYSELLDIKKCQYVVKFMRLLARKNYPKGHEICPCGSGERLRNCHRELLYSIREHVNWEYVAVDLQTVLREDRSKDQARP